MSKKNSNIGVIDKPGQKEGLKPPSMYKVVFHNDDYTSMEFVVAVLVSIFHLGESAAVKIMLNVHQKGKGVAGVFTHEIAETKMAQTITLAKKNESPLQVTIEPV